MRTLNIIRDEISIWDAIRVIPLAVMLIMAALNDE